jgi:hypothetical protein
LSVTSTRSRPPLVEVDDVHVGVYLADYVRRKLYLIVDVRTAERRRGRKIRIAMLEDVVTYQIEPWEYGSLAGLRVVEPRG